MVASEYENLAKKIIIEQETIIGPIAWREADKISGLSTKKKEIKITGEGKKVLEELVQQYTTLFGKASEQVCRDAAKDIIANMDKDLIPTNLA